MTTATFATAADHKSSFLRRMFARYTEYQALQVSVRELNRLSDQTLAEMGMERKDLCAQVRRRAADTRTQILAA